MFVVSLTCAIVGSAPASAAAAIPPGSLVARPADLPGFATASTKVRSATSPSRYASVVLGERPSQARSEAVRLKRKGFREGVQELLSGPQGEALSFALVLGSARIAEQEFQNSRRADLKGQGGAMVDRFAVPAIPGSLGFSAAEAGHSFAAANVLFATGRCFFVVGDSLGSATREQAASAPLAGATALYRRVRGLCADG
ncbi:MAG: hypothetical protein ACLQMH_18355 [Solirubrobacteraceae bacterium]